MVVSYNIINKVQNEILSPSGKKFDHPYLQAAISSFGQIFGFPHYWISNSMYSNRDSIRSTMSNMLIVQDAKETNNNRKKQSMMKWYIWIPSCLDMVEHFTRNLSMTLLAASATSMLRSTVVIFAALLSIFYLKNKLYRHHITGMLLITLGAFIVGMALIV